MIDMSILNPDKALIFRITHIDNVVWVLDNGLSAQSSATLDPNFRSIGSKELIVKRQRREVLVPPGGMLSDYVPFYFTPASIMLYNIYTGYGDVQRVPNEDIVIFVSSLHRMKDLGLKFVFTDRHAYLSTAEYFNELTDLDRIDWSILQARDFKHDSEDPGKKERYQAEALIHRHLPVSALSGIVCFNEDAEARLLPELQLRRLSLKLVVKPDWYFTT